MLAVCNDATGGSVSDHATATYAGRTLDIVPFQAWHLNWFGETTARPWLGKDYLYGKALARASIAFTAMDGMKIVCCAGVIQPWPNRAQAWSLLCVDIDRYIFSVYRATKRFLDERQFRRVECTVDPTNPKAIHWATRLGFVREGTMRCYTPQGDTMDLYARIQ